MIISRPCPYSCWPRMLARILACRPKARLFFLPVHPEADNEAFFTALDEELARQGLDATRVYRENFLPQPTPDKNPVPLFLLPNAQNEAAFHDAATAMAAPLAMGQGNSTFAPFCLPMADSKKLDQGSTLCPTAYEDFFVEQALLLLDKEESLFFRANALRKAIGMPTMVPPIMAQVPRPEGGLRRMLTHGLDLGGQLDEFYGRHRSGWNYALGVLAPLHNPAAPYLESFVEKRFNWGDWMGETMPPLQKPWLGFVHVPPTVPEWFSQGNTFAHICQTVRWKKSAPWCLGLFTLTRWLKEELEKLTDLPINVLPHPTETVDALWQPERWQALKKPIVAQAGITYRNLHAVHMLGNDIEKIILCGPSRNTFDSLYCAEETWLLEQGKYTPGADANTHFVDFISNEDYDRLFSENVIMCEYYTASASNTVVECMVRGTPLLINKLPPVVEYLGEDYPLYFENYHDATEKVSNPHTVLAAHHYLMAMDKSFLSPEYFLGKLMDSALYRSLG